MPKDVQSSFFQDQDVKKLVYFLMACEEKQAYSALCKYGNVGSRVDRDIVLLKKLKNFLNPVKKYVVSKENKKNLLWQHYCRNNHYEEILVVALSEIVKCPINTMSWILQIRPEILSYRLNQGLLILGEEILKEKKEASKEDKKQAARKYCHDISLKPLPLVIKTFSFGQNKRKWISFVLMGVMALTIVFLLVFFWNYLSKDRGPIILYQSP